MSINIYNAACAVYRGLSAVFHPIRVQGAENLPREGGYALLSNHINWRDPIVLSTLTGRPVSFMAKKELFKYKPVARLLTKLNAFPVDRGRADMTALRQALEVVKQGGALGIFPEGHRFTDGQLHEIKGGAALVIMRTGAPFVPVRISGSYKLFHRVYVNIGAPCTYERVPGAKIEDCTAAITQAMTALWRV